jgi:hypothetical protein
MFVTLSGRIHLLLIYLLRDSVLYKVILVFSFNCENGFLEFHVSLNFSAWYISLMREIIVSCRDAVSWLVAYLLYISYIKYKSK